LNVQQSLVLGVIQGLTEFLPISSTAHLILAPQLFPIAEPRAAIAHTYDTFIQIGTVIPVLIYFRQEWLRLIQAALRMLRSRGEGDQDERMVKYLLLGSIPAGVIGLAVEKHVEKLADPTFHPRFLLIGLALVILGLIMWWADETGRKNRTLEHVRLPDALFVGFAQALALFPGVSRSGATMTAGLFVGFTREAAARFSFLLMTPIMLAATSYKGLKMLKGVEPLTSGEWQSLLLATVVAAISGYFAIAFLLATLRRFPLRGYAIYRICIGLFSIGLFFSSGGSGAAPKTAPAPAGQNAPAAQLNAPATPR
jgi:undecaprenyl-diphosphatase